MMLRSSGGGRRKSGLALLGVSTIVLLAMGESMLYANALRSNGRTAEASVEGAASRNHCRSEAARSALTPPDFKPFVFVPLEPRPGGGSPLTLYVEAGVHINGDGDVVATFLNGSQEPNLYFWRDSGLDDNQGDPQPGWQGPLKDDSSNVIEGWATGINNTNPIGICGTRIDSEYVAFYYEFDAPEDREGMLDDIEASFAYDINEDGVVVGATDAEVPVAWHDTLSTPVVLPSLVTNGGTAAYGIEPDPAVVTSPHIVGASEDAGEFIQAVAWYKTSGWNVQDLSEIESDAYYGAAFDINAGLHVIGSIFETDDDDLASSHLWVYSSGPSWTMEDISEVGRPTAINNQTNPELVGYDPTTPLSATLWVATDLSHSTFDGTALDLCDMTIGLPAGLLDLIPTDINDDGEIVGMAEIDDTVDHWIPFKIVPYDVNNNGEPDFRDIIQNNVYFPDTNSNWLIDQTEQMRVGLYATSNDGENSKAEQVEYTQIVRLHIHQVDLYESIHDSQVCENQQDNMENWITGGSTEQPKEIMATIRCDDGDQDGYDRIYTASTTPTKDEFLDDLFAFAYRYAHTIDYIQLGNEIFSGPGEYYMYDVGTCDDGGINEIDEVCYAQACADVIAWIEEQMEVVRTASALAGRPLRIISPAFTAGYAITGQNQDLREPPDLEDENVRAAFAIDCIVDLANKHQLWTDMHLHYRSDTQLADALYALDNPGQYSFTTPDFQTCTEWSPIPTATWVDDNSVDFGEYFDDAEAPAVLWDDFVYAWGTDPDELNRDPFPGFDDDLTDMESYGLLMAIYGEFWQGHQTPNPPDAFDLTAVRANQVHADPNWIEDHTNLWTDLRELLESAADDVFIGGFDPHPSIPSVNCGVVVPRP